MLVHQRVSIPFDGSNLQWFSNARPSCTAAAALRDQSWRRVPGSHRSSSGSVKRCGENNAIFTTHLGMVNIPSNLFVVILGDGKHGIVLTT